MEHGDVWGATVIACTEIPLTAPEPMPPLPVLPKLRGANRRGFG
jgi:hypothetical protein